MCGERKQPQMAFHSASCVICHASEDLHHVSELGKAVCTRCAPVMIRQKIENTVRRYRMIRKREPIAVALSGGEDSASLLHALQHLRGRLSFSLVAVHVHMGLGEYSDRCAEVCREVTSRLGVPLTIERVDAYGVQVEATKQWPVCAVCGTVRRVILGRVCSRLGMAAYCLGHTMDDQLQYMLKRIISGRLDAPRPVSRDMSTYPRKCRPLFYLPDAALNLYARAVRLRTVEEQCPRFSAESHRFKQLFNRLEQTAPLSKAQFLHTLLPVMPQRTKYGDERPCAMCGETTTMTICPICRLRTHQRGEPVPDARGR